MSFANRWIVLAAVIATFLPVMLDMTILHVAVPTLTLALGATTTEVLWIIDIYPLIMAGLLVPMGTLGDRIGHRRIMLVGLCVFTFASVAAAFSTTAEMLIASRALLSVGGAMIMPAVLAIVRLTFDDEDERARALGIWTVVGAAGGAVGPLAGGILLEHLWWGSVFLINVPVMAVVLPIAYVTLPAGTPNRAIKWRIGQAAVFIVGLIATVYAIKTGIRGDGPAWQPFSVLGVGFALLAWFGILQTTTASPMLDLTLFRNPPLVAGLLMALVSSGALAGFELVLAQELQFVVGLSPLGAGLFMVPLMAAAAVAGPVAGWLVGRVGVRALSVTCLIAAAGSFAALAMVDLHGDRWLSGTLLAILGFALGSALLAGSVAIMGGVPSERAGAAGSLESTSFELGGALGITFFGSLIGAVYRSTDGLPAGGGSSIGDAAIAATRLDAAAAGALMRAAGSAFTAAHEVVLLSAAVAVAILAVTIFVILRGRIIRIETHV
ncbi:MFS transporter [Sphingomonas sp. CFBP 13714]|uniref:MFS transporter n=1 Tax=Sphingomonas sp. CFBP 13714 TaxID=2775308 RepID=UPI001784DDAE|nr:MFS transporter [Sphingomonas sp. CFBP 13714]MBD8702038.1 MFS transporter [Sphingomonas sp. CFBP 13714]